MELTPPYARVIGALCLIALTGCMFINTPYGQIFFMSIALSVISIITFGIIYKREIRAKAVI
jgi:hypothetical protein